MAASQYTPDQLREAIRLQSQCWTHERIARKQGVHRMTVSRHLDRYNRKAAERLEAKAVAERVKQIEQLRWAADEAATAWRKSKRTGNPKKAIDPRFLAELRGCLADIRSLYGIGKDKGGDTQQSAAPIDPRLAAVVLKAMSDFDAIFNDDSEGVGADASPGPGNTAGNPETPGDVVEPIP